jgi:hypothetical protein
VGRARRALGAAVRSMRKVSEEAWTHYRLHVATSAAERDAAFVRGGARQRVLALVCRGVACRALTHHSLRAHAGSLSRGDRGVHRHHRQDAREGVRVPLYAMRIHAHTRSLISSSPWPRTAHVYRVCDRRCSSRYLQRKRVVENISYERATETEALLQVWLTEPHIDKAHSTDPSPHALVHSLSHMRSLTLTTAYTTHSHTQCRRWWA